MNKKTIIIIGATSGIGRALFVNTRGLCTQGVWNDVL